MGRELTINAAIGLMLALRVTPAVPAVAPEWSLITSDEDARDAEAQHVSQPPRPAAPHAPVIEIKRPDISRPVHNPTIFDVRFRATPGATIDLQTFRAQYGWLGIDITARMLEHATKTATGLTAQNVDLPSGTHTITVSIADSAGRTGSRVLRLSVAK